jgi:uncharacterized membrane protein
MLVRVLQVLVAITITVICYYAIVWVLGMLGIQVPEKLLTAVMVLIGLLAVLGAITGRYDSWWGPRVG